ncbi:hypothetical protein [Agrobacterium rosae]|uniref:hypothetical protein n=1 Tax=Agrobacterium rosae TaxID=1972867 RepID=UPI000CD89443|nr:hypothetical protein [Agrobacterium rosae]POO56241.1 hypothetical protein CTT39_05765 [Agrobacterium rosae]
MILPGNSRQVIVDAIADCPIAPHATTSKIVSDLSNAGYAIVHRDEMIDILNGLMTIIKRFDNDGETLTDIDVAKATVLCDLLAD